MTDYALSDQTIGDAWQRADNIERFARRCSGCGRVDCDTVPEGYWDRLAAALERAPVLDEEPDGDDWSEPIL